MTKEKKIWVYLQRTPLETSTTQFWNEENRTTTTTTKDYSRKERTKLQIHTSVCGVLFVEIMSKHRVKGIPPVECGHHLEKTSLSNMSTGLWQSHQGPLGRLEGGLVRMESALTKAGVKVHMPLSHTVPSLTAPEEHRLPHIHRCSNNKLMFTKTMPLAEDFYLFVCLCLLSCI